MIYTLNSNIFHFQEQYEFLHELALEYMDKYDTHANFK